MIDLLIRLCIANVVLANIALRVAFKLYTLGDVVELDVCVNIALGPSMAAITTASADTIDDSKSF